MPMFAVYAPPGELASPEVAERIEFVPESFSFQAFLAPPLYLAAHRAWIGLLLYFGGLVLVNGVAFLLGAPATASIYAGLGYSFLFGLEAPGIRQWAMTRKGYRYVGSVSARSLPEAELRFFSLATHDRATARQVAAGAIPPAGDAPFLFPAADPR